ncbi:MAG: alpha/beta fold hydrolase [Anaerolineae bacterium]
MTQEFVMNLKFADINGYRIRYAESRQSGKPQLILTSPQPQSILAYTQWWTRLIEQFDIVAVDLPNHGGSDAAKELTTVSQQAAFMEQILDHFELDNPHYVGPDVGTPIGLRFMADHPRRIKSAVIGDAGAVGQVEGHIIFRLLVYSRPFQVFISLWGGAIGGRIYTYSANSVGYRRYTPPKHILADYRRGSTNAAKLRGQIGFLGSYSNETPQLAQVVPSIKTPILVLHGEKDTFVAMSNSQKLHELLPNSEFGIIEGAGHYSYEDNAEEYLAHVLRWIDKTEASPTA